MSLSRKRNPKKTKKSDERLPVRRETSIPGNESPGLFDLQQRFGNRAIQQLISRQLDRSEPRSAFSVAGGAPDVQRVNGGPISIEHSVDLIPQPTRVSCWAAALTMVIDFRDKMSYPVNHVTSTAGMNLTTGYGWSQIQNAVSTWGLQELAPMSAYPDWWADYLAAHGPLWIVEVGAPYHAVVLGGMHGDGTPGATEMHVYNPWPPNSGAVEYKTFEDFDREFGLGAGAGAAIVHA